MNQEEKVVVVIIDDTIHTDTPYGRAISRISKGMADFDIEVVTIASLEGARSAYANLPAADCILINLAIPRRHRRQDLYPARR